VYLHHLYNITGPFHSLRGVHRSGGLCHQHELDLRTSLSIKNTRYIHGRSPVLKLGFNFAFTMICERLRHLFILLREQCLGDLINMVAFHSPKEFCGQFLSARVPIKHTTNNLIPQLFFSEKNFGLGKQFPFELLVFGHMISCNADGLWTGFGWIRAICGFALAHDDEVLREGQPS